MSPGARPGPGWARCGHVGTQGQLCRGRGWAGPGRLVRVEGERQGRDLEFFYKYLSRTIEVLWDVPQGRRGVRVGANERQGPNSQAWGAIYSKPKTVTELTGTALGFARQLVLYRASE